MARKLKTLDNMTKHLTKDEIAEKKEQEIKATDGFTAMQITAPNHLNPSAKAEYKRIIEDVQRLPLRNLDRAMLENYCTWYAIYKEVSLKLKDEGTVIKEDELFVEHPLIKTLEKATKNLKTCASELGLTVDSRMRIYLPPKTEEKKTMFDKFGG